MPHFCEPATPLLPLAAWLRSSILQTSALVLEAAEAFPAFPSDNRFRVLVLVALLLPPSSVLLFTFFLSLVSLDLDKELELTADVFVRSSASLLLLLFDAVELLLVEEADSALFLSVEDLSDVSAAPDMVQYDRTGTHTLNRSRNR